MQPTNRTDVRSRNLPKETTRNENFVIAFSSLQSDLDAEKRAMQRIWSKREKEIERVVLSTTGMYGDLQGIIGGSLATIPALELPGAVEEETTPDGVGV